MPGNLSLFLPKTYKDLHMCVHMPRPQNQTPGLVFNKGSLKTVLFLL